MQQSKQPLPPNFSFNKALQEMTFGKQLLFEDLPFSRKEIIAHQQNGFILFRDGIETIPGRGHVCVRCGNQDSAWFATYPCARCGNAKCLYCRRCIMMGRISSCTKLISWSGQEPSINPLAITEGRDCTSVAAPNSLEMNFSSSLLVWSGKLSEGQQKASDEVVNSIVKKSELTVWAVCGSGKTEVLFAGIERALQSGQRVCIATPRTDVVLELTPRFQAVFPSILISSLYGGSPDRHKLAQLTIATTHQLMRFYQAFDTVVIDEVDAFPYSVDATLQHAVKQARKPNSALIYLTATPNEEWQKQCRLGKRAYVTIPARYHRHPLPIPEFVWCGNWENSLKKGLLPKNVLRWLAERVATQKQVLLFVPRIDLLNVILDNLCNGPLTSAAFINNPSFKEPQIISETSAKAAEASPPNWFSKHPVESVHSNDPHRKEKVQRMRDKEISILLTTTILERGVTFPNIDVAVLGSEDAIFCESALVQIAGRVGRSSAYPSGNVTFFHFGKTKAMVKARKQIIAMNKAGRERRLID